MRVRYSFSSRRTGNLDNINKRKEKIPHMVKEVIRISDIILEVLDARFIEDTRNEELEQLILSQGKKIIYVLNKSDLVSFDKTEEQIKKLKIYPYVLVSCLERSGAAELRNRIKMEVRKLGELKADADIDNMPRSKKKMPRSKKPSDKPASKSITKYTHFDKSILAGVSQPRRAQIGIIGYPNTGKSSLINILIGRKSAGTGAEAGFTKGIQKIRLSKDILVLDTPGIIPDKENSMTGKDDLTKHAKIGVRTYDKVREPEFVVDELMKKFPGLFEKYYGIDAQGNVEVLIEELGKKKGLLLKGNEIDFDRTARIILKDWQEARIREE